MTTTQPLGARLASAFAALDAAGVRWCLLRLPADLVAPTGDVDLLVDGAQVASVARVLRAEGFAAVPGWTSSHAMLWVDLDVETGRFLVLELTDRVTFGEHGRWRTSVAAGMLARSVRRGPLRVLADDDAFWALLLHCLLDKGGVPERYRATLADLAPSASPQTALAAYVLRPDDLLAAARGGRWDELAAADLGWDGGGPGPFLTRAARVLRAPLLLRRRRGASLALLGLNGAGKTTLARGVVDSFPFPVSQVYMGLWRSGGLGGSELPGLAQLLRPLRAWQRYLRGLLLRLRGHLVVFDRYVLDARLPPQPPLVAAKRAYFWLLARCIPAAELVVLLDLPPGTATARKDERTAEQNALERAGYLQVARQVPGIVVVDASRSPEQVRSEVLGLVWRHYRQRWERA